MKTFSLAYSICSVDDPDQRGPEVPDPYLTLVTESFIAELWDDYYMPRLIGRLVGCYELNQYILCDAYKCFQDIIVRRITK